MRRHFLLPAVLALLMLPAACGTYQPETETGRDQTIQEETEDMNMKIGETPVTVAWGDNPSVVFYGSNSWAYTRLGHITDQNADGMRALLADGDVTVTITAK